jgi:PAS domain S-box-containing protein
MTGASSDQKLNIRVLVLEDNPADAVLVLHKLKTAGLEVRADVARTAGEFMDRARSQSYDVVLGDYRLPDWNGLDALRWLRASDNRTPFILVTSVLGDELAVECIKEGATDYLLKDRLERLPVAVRRAVQEDRLHSAAEKLQQETLRLLRESEQHFRLMADNAPVLIWISGPDKLCTYFNKPWLEFTGRTMDSEAGNGWAEGVHPEDLRRCMNAYTQAFDRREEFRMEYRLRRHDGEYRWVLDIGVPMFDQDRSFSGYIGSCIDITDRKLSEEALQQTQFYLVEGQRLAHMGSWAFDATGFSYWSSELFRIHDLGPSGKAPTVEEYLALVHPEDRAFMKQGIAKMLDDHLEFDFTKRIVRPDGEIRRIRFVGVPVTQGGIFQGFLGTGMDVTDQEQLTDELRVSEYYLSEGQRLAHMGSWAFNPSGFFDYWSQELFKIYGLDPQKGAPTLEQYLATVHPQDRDFMANTIERMHAERSGCDVKKRIVRPDGEQRYIRWVGISVVEGEALKGFLGSAIDITEQEQLTQELQRREAYLAEAQRLSHTGSLGWKPDSGEIVWSDETYRIFEYDPAVKPTIDSVVQRVHPYDRTLAQQVIDRASQTGTDFEHEYRLLMADGRIKHVYAIAHALQDASGNREFIGAVTDVTGTRKAEEALRRSESYLAEAQRLTHTGSGAWRVAGDEALYLSEEWFRIYGFDPKQGLSAWKAQLQRMHPEDRAKVRAAKDRAIREKSDYDVEYRIVLPDGTLKCNHTLGHPVLNASGDVEQFVCTWMDITERKRAEDKIREQEMELRQILDLAPQIIVVYGPNREHLYANRILLDYLGLTLEEWRQKPDRVEFAHPDDWERVSRHFDRAIARASADELEFRLRKNDGSYRWFLVRFNPLRDELGKITRWYITGTDIEDRKQAEEKLLSENVALREEIDKASMFEEIVGTSPAMQTVLSRISKVAPSDSTVLITGETGTGKELVARAIHRRSDRSSRAFVSVNCAAVPRELIASELFGHEKGAFTGATQQRLGRFELANSGTLFLDEVGELPAETQIALLRVLQEHEFERVGGTRPIRADVRVIAATNRDLHAAISAGAFRSDLYYRLHVFPIEIPPLRERKQDIPLLVEYFIDRYAQKAGKKITTVDKKTLRLLESYPWPGNIRELQNVIERSIIVCETENFSVDESWLSRDTLPPTPHTIQSGAFKVEVEPRSEREIIEGALAESRGRVSGPSGAAARLGIPRSTLESRIRALKINKTQFKFG